MRKFKIREIDRKASSCYFLILLPSFLVYLAHRLFLFFVIIIILFYSAIGASGQDNDDDDVPPLVPPTNDTNAPSPILTIALFHAIMNQDDALMMKKSHPTKGGGTPGGVRMNPFWAWHRWMSRPS